MGVGDTPSFRHLDEQMRGFGLILRANRMLRRVGLGSEKIVGMSAELDEVRSQMHELAHYADRFNEYFSKDGWLAHGRMDFSAIKGAVDEYESRGRSAANDLLVRYYAPDNLGPRLMFLNGVEELRPRRRLIDLAFEDHAAERFHAVVPVLLMIIDGAVNDAAGRGFHAEELNLDVWNSMTAADGAINEIKSIFQRGRRRTRTEQIELPYRNGILHGMDLGYDNEVVAAKSWGFLFVVADWIADKKSEDQRRERFASETRVPTLRELAADIADNQRVKQANESWAPRAFPAETMDALNDCERADEGTPEEIVLRFLDFWQRRNYGDMARLYWSEFAVSPTDLRVLLADAAASWAVVGIEDRASAITHVVVDVVTEDATGAYDFRMIYSDPLGEALPRGLGGGEWRIVWVKKGTA